MHLAMLHVTSFETFLFQWTECCPKVGCFDFQSEQPIIVVGHGRDGDEMLPTKIMAAVGRAAYSTLKEPVEVECLIDAGKGDSSTRTKSIPLLLPHQILQYLMAAGVRVAPGLVDTYWTHLESVGNSWAQRVNDHSLIPKLGSSL